MQQRNSKQINQPRLGISNAGAAAVASMAYPPIKGTRDCDCGGGISILLGRTRRKGKLAQILWKRINDQRKKMTPVLLMLAKFQIPKKYCTHVIGWLLCLCIDEFLCPQIFCEIEKLQNPGKLSLTAPCMYIC